MPEDYKSVLLKDIFVQENFECGWLVGPYRNGKTDFLQDSHELLALGTLGGISNYLSW